MCTWCERGACAIGARQRRVELKKRMARRRAQLVREGGKCNWAEKEISKWFEREVRAIAPRESGECVIGARERCVYLVQ